MSGIKSHLYTHAKRIRYLVAPPKLPLKFLHQNVPYFSQWESPELVDKIIDGKIKAEDDPDWKTSGAKTKQEYHNWSWSGCGMACTKMLIAHRTGRTIPLVTIGKKCMEYGGYTTPLTESVGLIYKPYLDFVSHEYGWKAKIAVGMSEEELMHELSQRNFIIGSVNSQIRSPKTTPESKGGHLILLLGYDLSKKEFYFHNPSGTSKTTQTYARVSFDDFKKFFSGRGIIIQAE